MGPISFSLNRPHNILLKVKLAPQYSPERHWQTQEGATTDDLRKKAGLISCSFLFQKLSLVRREPLPRIILLCVSYFGVGCLHHTCPTYQQLSNCTLRNIFDSIMWCTLHTVRDVLQQFAPLETQNSSSVNLKLLIVEYFLSFCFLKGPW